MNGADPLAALRPAIAPAPVSWWPPAPGWWLLALLLLALLAGLAVWWHRRRQRYARTRYQREALALLNDAHTLPAMAQVIRRAAISAHGREQAATADWQQLCPALDAAALQLLRERLYRADAAVPPEALAALRAQVERWLQTLPPVER